MVQEVDFFSCQVGFFPSKYGFLRSNALDFRLNAKCIDRFKAVCLSINGLLFELRRLGPFCVIKVTFIVQVREGDVKSYFFVTRDRRDEQFYLLWPSQRKWVNLHQQVL